MPDRHRIELLCILVALATLAPAVPAQDYPSRPIRLIVTTPPGGLVDLLGRMFAHPLGERLGQPVVVENRSGGTTHIGVETMVHAPADGYVLLLGTSEMTMLPALKKKYPYDPLKDMTPVALVANSWTVFAVNPKVPANTLPELLSYAKAHPGAIRYGTNGIGSSLHIAVEMLRMKAGVDLVHVPYKGGAQAALDAVSGQIEMASLGIASSVPRRSQLRLLAQTGPTRHPMLADVPTTAELGMPEVSMNTWFGVMAPANVPPAVVARLAREIEPVTQNAGFKEKLFGIGCDVSWMPPAAFAAFIAEEIRKWARIIPALGIAQED
jgi:tripartite-type tricarboxylate transporter receptor subunit TctC